MNLQELADKGFALADELDQEAKTFHIYDDTRSEMEGAAAKIRAKAQDVLNLLANPEGREKLESSPLLSRLRRATHSLPASLDERERWFEQLYDAVVGFAHAKENWEVHFAANPQKYVELWEQPRRMEQEFEEQQRVLQEQQRVLQEQQPAREEAQRRYAAEERQKLARRHALAHYRASKPAHEAPCFAETRKNGLNCNRGDLVEIKKLPTVLSPPKKTEVAIKRCSQCWQIYKEYFEVDEATKQSRSRFLKPGETDIAHGYHFSSAEAEAYESIDFSAFLDPFSQHPSLKVVENSRESHFESEKSGSAISGSAISGSQTQENASETAASDTDSPTKMSQPVDEESKPVTNSSSVSSSSVETCHLCGELTGTIVALTGYNETFPDAVYQLSAYNPTGTFRSSWSSSVVLRRCPVCAALFEWKDVPQMYGSGNLDEEWLTRLDDKQATLVRALEIAAQSLARQGSDLISENLMNALLMYLSREK